MLSSKRLIILLLSICLTFTSTTAQTTPPPGPASVSSDPTIAVSSTAAGTTAASDPSAAQVSSRLSSSASSASSRLSSLSSSSSSRVSSLRPPNSSPTAINGAHMANPDVLLQVPELSVGKIELVVDNLQANINLNAKVAGLVTVNAGVAVGITKVNLTIADVNAELELIVRLGHLVDIVNRVFNSLDLNPLLIQALDTVTDIVTDVIGVVDGLLGSITQGGTTLNFLIDNLGNIVQEVVGLGSTIVGNYAQNMTFTGVQSQLAGGLTQKQYSYSPLNALVNIVFNTLGQIVRATVVKPPTSVSVPPGGTTAASTARPSSTG